MTITAAADGSALGNPGPAGWAWYVDDDCWAAGGWPHGTNNMGELMAVLDLLQQTAHVTEDLRVLCDSQYAINVISKWTPGWKRRGWRKGDGKPVQNVELVKALDQAMQGRRVVFEWVKGHAGHELNEAADARARAAAVAYQQGKEPATGPGYAGGSSAHPQVRPNQTEEIPALFELPELDEDLAAEERVVELERSLLTDAVRADPSRVAALLHPDWCEIGASGRIWRRAELLSSIGPLAEPTDLELIEAQRPATDQVLLLWRAVSDARSTLRSSVWVRSDNDWVQRFQQGTPEA